MTLTTTLHVGALKSAALALAGRDLKVFPLTPRGKTPLKGSNGHLDATSDPDVIERMWQGQTFANIGVSCAASGLYMVDVDMDPEKGKQGDKTWDALTAVHGHVDTFTVRSWSGGRHFWYLMPEGLSLTNTTGTGGLTGRGLGRDVDTRGNGYVVAPPSMVTEGGRTGQYVVERDLPFMYLPDWIAEVVSKEEPTERPAGVPGEVQEVVLQRVHHLAATLRIAPDGEGNDTAARVAFMAGQYAGAGQVDSDWAVKILLDAIAGWSWRSPSDYMSTSNTIIRGVAEGMAKPRAWERPVALPRASPAAVSAPSAAQEIVEALVVGPEPVDAVAIEAEAERDVSDWATNLGQAHHLHKNLPIRLIHSEGVGWFRWSGKHWAASSDGEVMSLVGQFYRSQFRAMLDKYKITEDEKWNTIAKSYKRFMSTATMHSIVSALKTIPPVMVKASLLDTNPHLINTPDGVLDLRDGKVVPHDPALLMTKITRGSYRPNMKPSDDWLAVLSGLPEETADYLQLRFGQAATGFIPEDAVFLVGTGKNSKSLILTDGTVLALGDYAYQSGHALIASGQSDAKAATPDKAGLRGTRLAFIEEMPEEAQISVAELKRVVETSTLTARYLNENPFTFPATHSLFVTTNYEPRVNQTDHGTWRRLCRVEFPIKFVYKPEGPNERKADPMLRVRMRAGEQGQFDAVMTWMTQGAMRYFADRSLVMEERRPLLVAEGTMAWRGKADRIMSYWNERLIADQDGVVASADVYADFTAFLLGQGHSKWAMELFASRFNAHEKTVRANVTKGRGPRNTEGLQRPPGRAFGSMDGSIAPLKPQPPVYRGVRFRTDSDPLDLS